jgi:CheY-like chemotaxis protein
MQEPVRPLDLLLVEDNDADTHLTVTALRDALVPTRIHVVKDGESAIEFLRHTGSHRAAPAPDLVLLDLNLSGIDGFQVLTEMKSDPSLKKIPVIVISGSHRMEDRSRAYELQAAGYLTKPAELDKYFTAIRSLKDHWFHTLSVPNKEPGSSA